MFRTTIYTCAKHLPPDTEHQVLHANFHNRGKLRRCEAVTLTEDGTLKSCNRLPSVRILDMIVEQQFLSVQVEEAVS